MGGGEATAGSAGWELMDEEKVHDFWQGLLDWHLWAHLAPVKKKVSA